MEFTAKQLNYPSTALSPFMSEHTILYHWGKHYIGYLNNLNRLVLGTEFEGYRNLEDIILRSEGVLYNNASQVWNHEFFFEQFSVSPRTIPQGKLLTMLEGEFGSFEAFVERFSDSAMGLFGSGWVWLVCDENQVLSIETTQNAINPAAYQGLRPIMTLDVWEHAYYLDYQNLRADFVRNFFKFLDWGVIERRY